MNAVIQQRYPHSDFPAPPRHPADDVRQALASASAILDQAPPPSLREILTAYRTKGDGDRDMLIAMLNAKTAEDQRLSSVASLQKTVLELYQQTGSSEFMTPATRSGNYQQYPLNYPPSLPYPPEQQQRSPRRGPNTHRPSSRSRSPPRTHAHMPPPPREAANAHQELHSRKRHRASHSPPQPPHRGVYEPSHPTEQFPPSPYSSSDRSESAEYSPRSRAAMNIGSLLSGSGGPRREASNEAPQQERE